MLRSMLRVVLWSGVIACWAGLPVLAGDAPQFRVATFQSDVTLPLGELLYAEPLVTIEERPAEVFSPEAVERRMKEVRLASARGPLAGSAPQRSFGCPGSAFRELNVVAPPPAVPEPRAEATSASSEASRSQLSHWPVQLALVPPTGRIWQDADVLIAADCVPFAMPDFHEKVLAGRSLAIACPKLDDVRPYVEKLADIFANNSIRSVTVAHMEVPCCSGIVHAVQAALEASGRTDIPVTDLTVSVDGRPI